MTQDDRERKRMRSAEIGIGLGVLAFISLISAAVIGSSSPPPEPPKLYTCPRTLPGGYELVSMGLTPIGKERDCRYVKRGVR